MTDDRTPAGGGGESSGSGGQPNRALLIVGLVVAAIAIVGVVVALTGDDDSSPATTAAAAATTVPAAETTTTAAETTTTVAETTTTAAETTTTVAETTTTEALSACAPDNLTLVTPGVLTVATGEPAFPPWVGTTDGENFDVPESQTGYEAAVVYEVARRMGFTDDQVVWVRTGFDEAIATGPKNFDFNVQQYSITEEREQAVDFSVPYYVTQQALVSYGDSAFADATTIGELKEAKLGAQIGTTSLDFIDNVIQPDEPAFVYNTNADAKAALDAGQIDGIVVDLPTGYFITAVEIEGSVITGTFAAQADAPDEFGFLFAEENTLVDCVNPALIEMTEDGTIEELIDTWLEAEGDVPEISG